MGLVRGRNVTVAIPSIPGREELLGRALDSVQAQTVAPQRVLVHTDVERHGAAWARNQLLRRIRTSWVAWLDDDDELLPDHLEVLLNGANQSGADLIYSNPIVVGARDPLAVCDDDGRVVQSPVDISFGPAQEQWLRERGNFIPITYLVRTSALRAVGGYPDPGSMPVPAGNNSGQCEDFLALIKLLDAGYRFFHVLILKTWVYRVEGQNTGGRGLDRLHEISPS
jgi:glycosyltransferase involved in cell wall biosynthesis